MDGIEDLTELVTTDTTLEYDLGRVIKKVYICPRGIPVHRGDQSRCGRQCMSAQAGSDIEYVDEEVLRTVVIRKQTIFDGNICIEGR